MEKEKLINLLTSEDEEFRKLGIEMLKSNYKLPKTLYVHYNWNYPTYIYIPAKSHNEYIEDVNSILYIIKHSQLRFPTIQSFIKAILKYNEE